MTHAECRVHDEAGALLASFTVDAMVRRFAARAPPLTRGRRCDPDHRTRAAQPRTGPGASTRRCPTGVAYVEPFRRRVRGVDRRPDAGRQRAGAARPPPGPAAGVRRSRSADVARRGRRARPRRARTCARAWDAVEAWYEEDERVFGHPRNPYHRADCVRTSRRLRVEVAGAVLVDTTDTVGVYETALDPKLYVRRDQVRDGPAHARARPRSYCPYKGTASYWTAVVGDVVVDDVAWSYEDPLPECLPIRGLLSFDPRAAVAADLPPGGAA